MPKGGARKASDKFAVGKGMDLDRHFEVLCLVNKKRKSTIEAALIDLNKQFAWFDDSRNETCRSYFKELWRFGFLERINYITDVLVNLDDHTWTHGTRSYYRLSKLGKWIISKDRKLFPFYASWAILESVKKGIYPQCEKLIKLCELEQYIPVNSEEHVRLTTKHNIYVEMHAGKAIKFGWLESTGIIYRTSIDKFELNSDYINQIDNELILDLFENVKDKIDNEIMSVSLKTRDLGIKSFNNKSIENFDIKFKNNSENKINVSLEFNLAGIFQNMAKIMPVGEIVLKPFEEKILSTEIESKKIQLTKSIMSTFIGTLDVTHDNSTETIFLPQMEIGDEPIVWELELSNLFRRLGLQVFPASDSDRPDAVIDLSGLTSKPTDLLAYFRDSTKEKILMETTINEYSSSKLKEDTIKKKRNLNKFERHKQFVLKIQAVGQIITADVFASNVSSTFENDIKSTVHHIISLIDKENLEYLITKNDVNPDHSKVVKILKSNQIIDKKLIDSIF